MAPAPRAAAKAVVEREAENPAKPDALQRYRWVSEVFQSLDCDHGVEVKASSYETGVAMSGWTHRRNRQHIGFLVFVLGTWPSLWVSKLDGVTGAKSLCGQVVLG